MIATGKYQHFKGGYYTVTAIAINATNGAKEGEIMVVYHNEQGQYFVRTASQFTQNVIWPDNTMAPRWKKVEELGAKKKEGGIVPHPLFLAPTSGHIGQKFMSYM
jgi:hypothetical protein